MIVFVGDFKGGILLLARHFALELDVKLINIVKVGHRYNMKKLIFLIYITDNFILFLLLFF